MTAERPEIDRLSRVMAAALLTSICLLPAMLMPYLVGAVALAVTPDSRQLGFVAAAVLGGPIALMGVSVMWVRRYPWRRLVFWGLLLAALGYLLAAAARDFATLVASIAFGSSALAIAYAPPICSLSDTSDPDRNFGYAFFLQIIASGLVGLGATALQDQFGHEADLVLICGAVFACSLDCSPRDLSPTNAELEALRTSALNMPSGCGDVGVLSSTPGPLPFRRSWDAWGAAPGSAGRSSGNVDRAVAPHWCTWIVIQRRQLRRLGRVGPLHAVSAVCC